MKQALVTGGARGIGFGIAEAMLAAGYRVTVTGLSAEEAAKATNESGITVLSEEIRLTIT